MASKRPPAGRRVKFNNARKVNNQVGGNQNIAGSQYYGTVNYINGKLDDGSSAKDEMLLDQEILASLAFPEMLDRMNNIEQAHSETCRWILELEDFRKWRTNPYGLLWIKGKPGSGKSTLMKFLYEEFEVYRSSKSIVCLEFFFNARGTKLQKTPEGMLRSLLNQLFVQSPDCRSQVRKVYTERQKNLGSSQKWEWQRPDLEKVTLNAIGEVAQHQPVGIFVDALDEAGEDAARAVARYFNQVNQKIAATSSTAKICVSCRHYPIMNFYGGIEVCVEDHNTNDIVSYINDTLQIEDLVNVTSPDRALWQQLRNNVIKRAQGLFQWVRLVVDLIDKDIRRGRSIGSIQERLRHVPSGLDEVYRHILCEIIDVEDRGQSLAFFQWLSLTKRPLSLTEMRYAVVTTDVVTGSQQKRCEDSENFIFNDEQMKRRIQSLSGGLAEVVEAQSNGPEWVTVQHIQQVQVVHQSVLDFLWTRGLSILMSLRNETASIKVIAVTPSPESKMTIQLCHGELYRNCLSYLATENFQWPDGIDPTTICIQPLNDQEQTWSQLLSETWPLSWYCITYLLEHAKKAAIPRMQEVNQEIDLLELVIDKWPKPIWNGCTQGILVHEDTTLLHIIAQTSLDDITEQLFAGNAAINAMDILGWTPLHYAARSGQLFPLKTLIEHGANVNAATEDGNTPLMFSVSHQNLELSMSLIKANAEINSTTISGESALIRAIRANNHGAVRALIDAGAEVNIGYGRNGYALGEASRRGSRDMMNLLLEAGAEVNARSPDLNKTALWTASFYGHHNAVELLLDAGADPCIQNNSLEEISNALEAGSWYGSLGTVWALLKAGARVNAQSHTSGTALQIAARFGHDKILLLLLIAGANPNSVGGKLGHALQAAAANDHYTAVRLLLHAGADVDAWCKAGVSTLRGDFYSDDHNPAYYPGLALEALVEMADLLSRSAHTRYHYGHVEKSCSLGPVRSKLIIERRGIRNMPGKKAARMYAQILNHVKACFDASKKHNESEHHDGGNDKNNENQKIKWTSEIGFRQYTTSLSLLTSQLL